VADHLGILRQVILCSRIQPPRQATRGGCFINNRLQNLIPPFTQFALKPAMLAAEFQAPMTEHSYNILDLDATLADLPGYGSALHPEYVGQVAFDLFSQQPTLPGILVQDDEILLGMISRRLFFERTGKRFGTEVYLKRTLGFFLTQEIPAPLELPADTRLSDAARRVLARPDTDVYEPIVEQTGSHSYRIIHSLTIFAAQNQILVNLHNAQILPGGQGSEISDEQAIARFVHLAGISANPTAEFLRRQYHVLCPTCGQTLSYTLADIVRSHPQIKTGIEVLDRMGTRTYIFNLRHTCGCHLIEIPLVHDQYLEYRSMKPHRLVDTYV
jgi:hypothetical protein